VNVPKFGAHQVRALPQLAWQVSAVPAQLLGLHGAERRGLPFLAAVTGTAALGVVDWPVALLIAGGYLLTSGPSGQSPAAGPPPASAPHDATASGRTPAAPPPADPKPAGAQPAPARSSAAEPEPEPSSPTVGVGSPTATPAAPLQQPGQPAPVSVEQTSPQAATSAAAARPEQPPAPAAARQQRQSRPAREPRRAPIPAAAPREPWPGYDQMTVPRVLARLDDPDVDLGSVERYETAHRDRKMVHAAITSRQASRQT